MKSFKEFHLHFINEQVDIEESLKDWVRNIVLAASLFSAGEKDLSAEKITLYPGGRAVYTDTGEPVDLNKKRKTIPQNTLLTVKADTPEARKELLKKMAIASGIKGVELRHFLAQASHETLDFSKLEEIGSSDKFEKKYGLGTKKGKILGNDRSGDGSKYRGRGFLQLTGKYNYDKIGKMINLNLVSDPGMVSKYPGVAAATAIAYWKWRVKPNVKSFTTKNSVQTITKQIAGSSTEKHLGRRQYLTKKIKT